MGDPHLNRPQRQVVALLGVPPDERPTYDPELVDHLQAQLDDELATVLGEHEEQVLVTKKRLADVHGCEGHYLAPRDATERGSLNEAVLVGHLVHKAVELSVTWRGQRVPLDLVEAALDRLADREPDVAMHLAGLGEAERAELTATVNDQVVQFFECFPVIERQWRPVSEGSMSVDLAGGRVRLWAKPDLTLGTAIGTTASKVIFDLKTGSPTGLHREDLAFYALVDTLRIGTPPRHVASVYLRSGKVDHQPVDLHLLGAAQRRVVDGVRKMVRLAEGAPPTLRPGPSCAWCPARLSCPEALT